VLPSLWAQKSLLSSRAYRGRSVRTEGRLRGGAIEIESTFNREKETFIAPPAVHPVVDRGWVIYRNDEAVVGRDLLTGELVFKSFHLPLERDLAGRRTSPIGERWIGDDGRYGLTVGGGMVYALADFIPYGLHAQLLRARRTGRSPEPDTSLLVALSLADEGREVWRLGGPDTDDDVASACKFLSAPTYVDGRLYVLAVHLERYYLLCIEAESGELIWRSEVAQQPPPPAGRSYYTHTLISSSGSPPAVSEGRVFVTTNTGVVAAIDAETGEPIWAVEYPSDAAGSVRTGQGVKKRYPSANPLIVARGLLVCLPADHDRVMALRVESGREAWQQGLGDRRTLSALDDERVLLTGEGFAAVSLLDGPPARPTGHHARGGDGQRRRRAVAH
jgi:outer membrane protein assembly factor BamB